jgi:hypothetical protein
MTLSRILLAFAGVTFLPACLFGGNGQLRVHPENPRYFTDDSGKVIYLTGMHTWNNLVDIGPSNPPAAFDFPLYLDQLEKYHHNFIRLWAWQHFSSTWEETHLVSPMAWLRTGPAKALDGDPAFDLTRFNQEYFDRLRARVKEAGARGIYVSIMLFEGWGLQFNPKPWEGHPFHARNNINGIDGDPNRSGKGLELNMWEPPRGVWELQKAYVRQVIDAVNDLDNVLYEVINEAGPYSTLWQYQVINFVKGYEAEKAKQHPIGMTFQYKGGSNTDLFNSPADWISPNPAGGYRDNPPAADGSKVILSDTDHLWGIGGNRGWVWKSFCRGLNPLFMDPYFDVKEGAGIYDSGNVVKHDLSAAKLRDIRQALGFTRLYAEKLNLPAMTPRNELSSTGFCLAKPGPKGAEFLVYLPEGPHVTVDLTTVPDSLSVEWFNPSTGSTLPGDAVTGGVKRSFQAPFAGEAVLYLVQKPVGNKK